VHIQLPRDASLDGRLVDGAITYLTLTTGVAFLIAVAVLAAAVVFHHERAGRTHGHHTHGRRPRDRALTFGVALATFLVIDVMLAARAQVQLGEHFWRYPDRDPRALRVEVLARQWAWTFRTAGPDGTFGTPDDIVTLNELNAPVGRPIYFKLRSRDVVHALYLPSFRTKIDAIPGSTTRAWIEAEAPGRYEIACAQHCGVNHYKMRAVLVARAETDYDAWLARAETDGRLRNDAAVAASDAWDWESGR
jgi:cytochrome c oxidase subunit II